MTQPVFIRGSTRPRPEAARTLYVDCRADAAFAPGRDLELNHWLDNQTPALYRADTAVAICLKYLEAGATLDNTLLYNDHLDGDGVLALFALAQPELALAHRETLVQAAATADYWAWAPEPALTLFQGLAHLLAREHSSPRDPLAACEAAFVRIRAWLAGAPLAPGEAAGLSALQEAVRRVETGAIERTVCAARFVHYHLPAPFARQSLARTLHVPGFNAPLSHESWLLPQARNRLDRERVQLVSAASEDGWYYDLHYPGHMWGDTPDSWRAPGVRSAGNREAFSHPTLARAVGELNALERGSGRWTLAETLTPYVGAGGRPFPVVLSVLGAEREPVPSCLHPKKVIPLLAGALGTRD